MLRILSKYISKHLHNQQDLNELLQYIELETSVSEAKEEATVNTADNNKLDLKCYYQVKDLYRDHEVNDVVDLIIDNLTENN